MYISKIIKWTVFLTKNKGGRLSPLLFITFMDELIKNTKQKIKQLYIGYKNLERIAMCLHRSYHSMEWTRSWKNLIWVKWNVDNENEQIMTQSW